MFSVFDLVVGPEAGGDDHGGTAGADAPPGQPPTPTRAAASAPPVSAAPAVTVAVRKAAPHAFAPPAKRASRVPAFYAQATTTTTSVSPDTVTAPGPDFTMTGGTAAASSGSGVGAASRPRAGAPTPLARRALPHAATHESSVPIPSASELVTHVTRPAAPVRVRDVLSEQYASVFAFDTFNPVQSSCIDAAFNSDADVVVGAPTGCGKTVVAELCFLRRLIQVHTATAAANAAAASAMATPNPASSVRATSAAPGTAAGTAETAAFAQPPRTQKTPMALGKLVYLAPIRSLAQERLRDWQHKFGRFGLKCCVLSSDMALRDAGRSLHDEVADADIIMTTPEKWDSATRRWTDHVALIGACALVVVDEVHTLGEDRGAALEAVVARMKAASRAPQIVSRGWPAAALRIVALSATIPDASMASVAQWVGATAASCFTFGPAFRPVPLTLHVLAYDPKANDYMYQRSLQYRVTNVISTYSKGKPALVFCGTRKSVRETASRISDEAARSLVEDTSHQTRLTAAASGARDPSLRPLLQRGVAFYCADQEPEDHRLIESLLTRGDLKVVCATTSLAVGVNFPIYLVVLMGTTVWMGKASGNVEMPRSRVTQMLGRAGRPQFDTEGVGVIMTSRAKRPEYEQMRSGTEGPIESHLEGKLAEALNSEIVLKTVASVDDAVAWLKSTFHYALSRRKGVEDSTLRAMLMKHLTTLLSCGFARITGGDDLLDEIRSGHIGAMPATGGRAFGVEDDDHDDNDHDDDVGGDEGDPYPTARNDPAIAALLDLSSDVTFEPSQPGVLMAHFYLSLQTMTSFATVTPNASLEALVKVIAASKELADHTLRRNEKAALNELNKASRWRQKGRVMTVPQKVFQLIVAELSRRSIEPSLRTEVTPIIENSIRACAALVSYLSCDDIRSPAAAAALMLHKCLVQRMWEDPTSVLFQLEDLTARQVARLTDVNITLFEHVREAAIPWLETVTAKPPPFGRQLREACFAVTEMTMTMEQVHVDDEVGEVTIRVNITHARADAVDQPCDYTLCVVIDDPQGLVCFELVTEAVSLEITVPRPAGFPAVVCHLIHNELVGIDCMLEENLRFASSSMPPPEQQSVPKAGRRTGKQRRGPRQQSMETAMATAAAAASTPSPVAMRGPHAGTASAGAGAYSSAGAGAGTGDGAASGSYGTTVHGHTSPPDVNSMLFLDDDDLGELRPRHARRQRCRMWPMCVENLTCAFM